MDAYFAGYWSQAEKNDLDNDISRTGYIIRYAVCSIGWCSKFQTEISLSTAEVEYITPSQALRTVIPLMTLVE